MAERVAKDLNLAQLAAEASLSKFHFLRSVQKRSGHLSFALSH
jgi:hypothetical protein